MTARTAAIAVGAVAVLLVLAQFAFPQTPLYHTWQYALALVIALAVLGSYVAAACRGRDGRSGRRIAVAGAGAAVVALAGLAAGLLGPDTATIPGTPGTVVPVPSLGAAAFFAPASAPDLARGDAAVTLRRRDASPLTLKAGERRPLGESLLYLQPQAAGYVEATDAEGRHVTVTQPRSSAFLSPVLLFPERQRIGEQTIPLDTFATPAKHLVFRALYFTAQQLAAFRHAGTVDSTHSAVILTASDDAGTPRGIALAPSGTPVALAGVHLRITLGSYPALALAAAPDPWALGAGFMLIAGGALWAALGTRIARPLESSRVCATPPGSVKRSEQT